MVNTENLEPHARAPSRRFLAPMCLLGVTEGHLVQTHLMNRTWACSFLMECAYSSLLTKSTLFSGCRDKSMVNSRHKAQALLWAQNPCLLGQLSPGTGTLAIHPGSEPRTPPHHRLIEGSLAPGGQRLLPSPSLFSPLPGLLATQPDSISLTALPPGMAV